MLSHLVAVCCSEQFKGIRISFAIQTVFLAAKLHRDPEQICYGKINALKIWMQAVT
jgi:hypothetical protein